MVKKIIKCNVKGNSWAWILNTFCYGVHHFRIFNIAFKSELHFQSFGSLFPFFKSSLLKVHYYSFTVWYCVSSFFSHYCSKFLLVFFHLPCYISATFTLLITGWIAQRLSGQTHLHTVVLAGLTADGTHGLLK